MRPIELGPPHGAVAVVRERGRWAFAELIGPVWIVVVVLAATWRTLLGRVPTADVLTLWIPLWTYLGRSLAAGHLPLWQPAVMSGSPFAADVQSGWGYYEPMLLFSLFSPDVAIRAMLVLQPLTAGVALYWFLRSERVPRVASCCGGLALALGVTQSTLFAALPFSASLALTAVTLGCCSRIFAAGTWARRLLWSLAAAVAWGQIMAAHAGLGLMMGSVTILAFVIFRAGGLVRARRWGARTALGWLAAFAALVVGVNLLFLLPAVTFVGQTSLSLGYSRLVALGRMLFGEPSIAYRPPGAGLGWPLAMVSPPGAYVGAAVLVGAGLALCGRRRGLAWPFLAAGAVIYLLTLSAVADAVPRELASTLLVGLYLHAPNWLGYELMLIVPVLGAIGLAAWPQAGPGARRAAIGLAAVLVVAALALGVAWPAPATLAVGVGLALAILTVGDRRPQLLWLLPLVLVAELGIVHVYHASPAGVDGSLAPVPVNMSASSQVPLGPAAVLGRTSFARVLAPERAGRYIFIDTSAARARALPGHHVGRRTEPAWFPDWPLVSGARGIGSYRAVVLTRYWRFVRTMGAERSNYEHILFDRVHPTLANLLDVHYVIRPSGRGHVPGERLVARSDRFALYRIDHHAWPVSLLGRWRAARSPLAALAAVHRAGFDPHSMAVVEGARGRPGPYVPGGSARYHPDGPAGATVTTNAPRRELLLVRTPYAAGWSATVDGRTARVLPTDYVDQGVIVPAGRHVVRFTFTDPWVMRGLAGTLAVLGVTMLAAAALGVRGRAALS